ncbi:hypothetical protein M0811_01727 [Anaeramoeba ignava]|uniref:BTB domain-containing protein n=1 Tax=Anaeramoeba ignava TaxID=1746090 RepID=A0A9Q0LCR8_ANAIG|nr:hypothetical protein M0811_01727 [Anaeramoeba ignava]
MSILVTEIKNDKENIPSPRCYVYSFIYNNKIHYFGGVNDSSQRYNNILTFDLKEKKWGEIPTTGTPPTERSDATCCVYDDYFYVFSGYDGNICSDFYQFDLLTNNWKKIPLFGEPEIFKRCSSGSHLFDGKLYIFAGELDGMMKNNIFYIDLKNFQIVPIDSKPFQPSNRSYISSVEYDSKLWFCGINSIFLSSHDFMVVFDLKTNSWIELKTKSEEINSNKGKSSSEIELSEYSLNGRPSKIILKDVDSENQPSTYAQTSVIVGDELFIIGGMPITELNLFSFNFSECEWSKKKILASPSIGRLAFHTSVYDPISGCIYNFGGATNFSGNWERNNNFICVHLGSDIQKDLKQLLLLGTLSDAQIQSNDNHIFPVHKLMFYCRVKNIQFEYIAQKCKKYSRNVVWNFLLYIYTGLIEENPPELIELAHFCNLESFENLALKFEENNTLIEDLENLYHDEITKDFTITSNSNIIRVHKMIMAARSDLYRGMLTSVIDSSNTAPDLSNRSTPALIHFIHFLYTGSIDHIDDFDIAQEIQGLSGYYGLRNDNLDDFLQHFISKSDLEKKRELRLFQINQELNLNQN